MKEQWNKFIDEYYQVRQDYPILARTIDILVSLSRYLFRAFVALCRSRLDSLCMSFCFFVFIFILYFEIILPVKLLLCFVVYIVACIGLSYLDYTERLYERQVENVQFENARKMLTLGVDSFPDGSPKVRPQLKGNAPPESLPAAQLTPEDQAVARTVELAARLMKIQVDFDQMEMVNGIANYHYYLQDNKPLGSNTLSRFAVQLQQSLKLKGLPQIVQQGNNFIVALDPVWFS